MSDEIEVGSVLAGQAERIPAHPDDEIGVVGTLLVEAVQARGTGKVTVADAYLAPDGCAALDGLGTVLVGQLEMREAATSEVVNRVQPPTGRLAARLAQATAVASTQAASDPTHGRTRSQVRQLAGHHGVQELDRLVEPILHRWIAHLGQAEHRRPGGGLAQRQATGGAGQHQAEQVSAPVERTPALDRLGLSGEAVKIESGGKSPQQLFKLIRRERCCGLHLPRIVPTRAGSRAYFNANGDCPSIKRAFRRRSAVEPVIGHLKNEHRMGRNYLAHSAGDAINAVLAAAGYNFRLLLRWLALLWAWITALLTLGHHHSSQPQPA